VTSAFTNRAVTRRSLAEHAIRAFVALAVVACGSSGDKAPPARPGPAMVPAPYIKPVVGTRLVYDSFTTTIVKADHWRVEFRDDRGVVGARVGGFIADNPKVPLILDTAVLRRLWPLRLGNAIDIEAQRYPLIWRWHIAVTGTARIVTMAGTFDCYVVESTETPVIASSSRPYLDNTRYFYAPAINQVVRIEAERVGGPGAGARLAAELVRYEEPGRPAGDRRADR
jgi:hypothetical protein